MNEQISTIQTIEVLELMRNLAPILNQKELFEFMLFSNRVLERYMPEHYNDGLSEEETEMKDIEWLKEELLRDLMRFNGNPNMTDYELGIASGIGTAINLTEKLDEPKKPFIPQFVADWIERCKEAKHNLCGVLEFAPTKVDQWIFHTHKKSERVDLVARAWLDGYEVEEEPRWAVKIGKGYFSGYDETKVTYVLDNFPGETARRIVYDDLNEAESDANDIGGEVEEVTE